MEPHEIEDAINRAVAEHEHAIHKAIREHEIRIAILSGIPGLLLLAGTWHAIVMLR
jgi:hypothetical protein